MPPDLELEEELARSHPTWALTRRIAVFLKPYWRLAIAPLLIEVFWVVTGSLNPQIVRLAIDRYLNPATKISASAALHGIVLLAALLTLNVALTSVLSTVQRMCLWRSGQRAMTDLRKWLFGHIQALSMDYFDREKQGRIIARVDRDVDYLEDMLSWGPVMVLNAALSLIVAAFWLTYYDWRLCLLMLAVAPLVGAMAFVSKRWGLRAYRRIRLSVSRMTAHLAENITGVHVVQAFGQEEHNLARFQGLLEEYKSNFIAGAMVRGVTFPSMMFLFGLTSSLVILYAGYAVPAGRLGIGQVAASIMYIGMLLGPITMIGNLYDMLLSASAAGERIVQLMDRTPSVRDKAGARPLPIIKGEVRFDHVFFKYDDAPEHPWILEDICFDAKPGEIVALVGPTGAGKTSIVNLIPRFYQAQRGVVSVDGFDVRDVTQRSLHRQMAIVLQDNFLFTGTVMDNLKYGRPNATDEEAVAAAQALGSHDLILRLADGYATDVRERGGAISHGERQLICFTRALIANPRVLILDEATSAVDTETEQLVQKALWTLMESRTTFVVAHRLSTVRHAHNILVVSHGRLVESGTHEALLGLGGAYAHMFEQFIRSS